MFRIHQSGAKVRLTSNLPLIAAERTVVPFAVPSGKNLPESVDMYLGILMCQREKYCPIGSVYLEAALIAARSWCGFQG